MEPPKKRRFLGAAATQAALGNGLVLLAAASVGPKNYNSSSGGELLLLGGGGSSSDNSQAAVCSSSTTSGGESNYRQERSVVVGGGGGGGGGGGPPQQHVVSNSEGGGGPEKVTGVAARRNRRKYSLQFKVSVLDGYYNDPDTRYNQRKTALKYGVNRRQIQKWLAQEASLRTGLSTGLNTPHRDEEDEEEETVATATASQDQLNLYHAYQHKISFQRSMERPLVIKTEFRTDAEEEEDTTRGDRDFGLPPAKYVIDEDREEEEEEEVKPINLSKGNQLFQRAESSVREPKMTGRSHPDPVSTHILDTALGLPATHVPVAMFRMTGGGDLSSWMKINTKLTNEDGRASGFLSWEDFHVGTYKMHFATGSYFSCTGRQSFYPFAEVVFEIRDPSLHYHIPLLLSPYGYSTYRGS